MLSPLRLVFLTPLPLETKAFLAGSIGQSLLEQALHAATQVGPVILGWINEQLEVDGAVTFSGVVGVTSGAVLSM